MDIDPSEAASIRLAFAFALESAGVSGAKMAAACKRLGLEADFSFSESDAKVYTALSREEVRDVIEQSLGDRSEKGRKIVKKEPELLIEKDEIKNIKVLKTFVSESLDLYIEAEEKGLEDKYPNSIGGACMEAKIENLMNFKCNYLLESGPAAVHDAGMPLQDCMGKEIKLLIEDEKDDSKMTWDYVAKKVKAKLVGQVRPIYTATVERDENDEITSVKYEPARDINGQPLVREVEPEDLDKIGKAVMATIVDGV